VRPHGGALCDVILEQRGEEHLHFGLRVADLDGSLAFYAAVGYEVVGSVPETPLGHLTMLKLPGDEFVSIELVHDPTEGEVNVGRGLSLFVIKVESMDATIRALAARGIGAEAPVSPDGSDDFRTTWVIDPDGNCIELVQWPAGHAEGISAADWAEQGCVLLMDVHVLFAGVAVGDVNAAQAWYEHFLAGPSDVVEHEGGGDVAGHGMRLAVHRPRRRAFWQPHRGYAVPDIETVVADLDSPGVSTRPIEREGDGGRKAVALDPEWQLDRDHRGSTRQR
jgi:lactoylglutathione lyase